MEGGNNCRLDCRGPRAFTGGASHPESLDRTSLAHAYRFAGRNGNRSFAILEDPTVRQMRLAMILMTGAESSVRNRYDSVEELRLLPRMQFLLEIVGHRDQLRFVEGGAVHQHAGRSAG